MCFHTPGCPKTTGTLLSGRLEINQSDWGWVGSRHRQNVLSYSWCSRNTGTLLSGRLDINQRGGGKAGSRHRQNELSRS